MSKQGAAPTAGAQCRVYFSNFPASCSCALGSRNALSILLIRSSQDAMATLNRLNLVVAASDAREDSRIHK